jgi:ABC-type lipoprotein release transport system permease subunit
MKLNLTLAWRNLWRHRRRTLIVISSIALILAMMMMYDGLMGGFNGAIYANAVNALGGNVQVHAPGYGAKLGQNPMLPLADSDAVIAAAEANPAVKVAARRINTGGLATNREGAFPLQIVGVEPEREQSVALQAGEVVAGRYLQPDDRDMLFIGKGLADAMSVGVGDRITLVGRDLHQQMRSRTMTIVGIYDLGMGDLEKTSAFMSLAEAQDLYGLSGQATEVILVLNQLGSEPAVIAELTPRLPGYEITPWQTNFPELYTALNSKNAVMDIVSVVLLLISGIGILNLLLMAVFERTREIGLLAALGMRPGQISILFLIEGIFMGLIGAAAGVALGLLINGIMGQVGIDFSAFTDMTSYTALISDRIYFDLGLPALPKRLIVVLVIALLASFIPAREAANKEPATALHAV